MAQELNISTWHVGKQTAKATENTTLTKRLKHVGGDLALARDVGQEKYSDGTLYGGTTKYLNGLSASGTPAFQATPDTLAYLLWLHHGGETTSAVTGPPAKTKHTYKPSLTAPFWCTFTRSVGISPVQRHSFIDCLVGGYTLEASQAQKVMRITPQVFSADPFKVIAADPAVAFASGSAGTPWVFTEASGTLTMNGVQWGGISNVTFAVTAAKTPIYGDDVVPYDFVSGEASATISITMVFDATGVQRWNYEVYGTTTPTTGTKPLRGVTQDGTFSALWTQKDSTGASTGNKVDLDVNAVAWEVPAPPEPNVSGGTAEVTITGAVNNPGAGGDPFTIAIDNDNAAYTV